MNSILKPVAAMVAAAAASFAAGSANAAVTLQFAAEGDSFTVNYNGFASDNGPTIPGLTAVIKFTLEDINDADPSLWTLSYLVDNTTSGGVNSRVSAFGFNVDPNTVGASVQGAFASMGGTLIPGGGDNVPNGINRIELCFSGNNCAGGGGGGVWPSTPAGDSDGTISLDFAGVANPGTVTLSTLYVRYQSISGAGAVTSATGLATGITVPEPATWAMMIGGFGGVGALMRRRRQLAHA